jgi:hypothetical protein
MNKHIVMSASYVAAFKVTSLQIDIRCREWLCIDECARCRKVLGQNRFGNENARDTTLKHDGNKCLSISTRFPRIAFGCKHNCTPHPHPTRVSREEAASVPSPGVLMLYGTGPPGNHDKFLPSRIPQGGLGIHGDVFTGTRPCRPSTGRSTRSLRMSHCCCRPTCLEGTAKQRNRRGIRQVSFPRPHTRQRTHRGD